MLMRQHGYHGEIYKPSSTVTDGDPQRPTAERTGRRPTRRTGETDCLFSFEVKRRPLAVEQRKQEKKTKKKKTKKKQEKKKTKKKGAGSPVAYTRVYHLHS
ncbi:hypothetical protein F2P81_010414 [Scophthalmus maximus]|uniref:Uncharacterized protein n=1 Tax=Scophthalmus maximus TaxID=52904 RepID=A0A6A4T0K7_SCOMX|nr:hypothetical protein F2P81_010414 [Scophthalmus maximus]